MNQQKTVTAKSKQKRCNKSVLADRILYLDRFGKPLEFNIKGYTHIGSAPGTALTLVLFLVLASYSFIKG
jgi:hypothetical protein